MHAHPLLCPVKPDKRFILPDGSSISSLKELAQRMNSMPSDVFRHHVNASKNDFYSWISHVVRDTHLSKEMKDLKDQSKIARLVSKRVAELEARDARNEISHAVVSAQGAWQQPKIQPPSSPRQQPPSPAQARDPPRSSLRPPFIETRAGFKPLTSKKRYRPAMFGDPHLSQESTVQSPTREQPAKESEDQAPELIESPDLLTPTIPVTIDSADSGGEGEPESDDEEGQRHEVPTPPLSYYSPTTPGTSASRWPSPSTCDHSSHFSCMRCGMLEFGIGLTIGILTTLMFSKAFL